MAEQQQLSGHERRAMEQLVAFLSQCSTHGKALRERLSTVPGGWRDWRLMESLAAKLYCALGETLTDRQFIQFKKLEQFGANAPEPLPNSSRRSADSSSGDQPVRSEAASTVLPKPCGASLGCVTAGSGSAAPA